MTNTRLLWHALFALFLAIYIAMLASQLGHGLASLDGHAIVKVTRQLVDQQRLEVSRPPGHPTTEVYLFPAVAWLLKDAFSIDFSEQIYLGLQGIAAVAALCIFYSFLLRLGTQPWKALLASACLGLSPTFFFNSVDGEEFVFALLFLMLSLHLLPLGRLSRPSRVRLVVAVFLFALATGCRPEVIFAGFLVPIYAWLHPKLGWKSATNVLALQVVAVGCVWLPIVVMGLRPPYTAGMNVAESILGGSYRLIFQCFTPVAFLFVCWVLFLSLKDWPQRTAAAFPENFVFIASCVTPVVFFIALFFHASKPAHVLFAVPFLLMLAAQRLGTLLIGWTIATVFGFFITIDIFQERQLIGPHLVAGSYFGSVRQKPFYKLPYLQQILPQCGSLPTAAIVDLWRWDFEYHIARGTFAGQEDLRPDGPMFRLNNSCVLLPRDAALHPQLIDDLAKSGYAVKMDATLYRTLFARYRVKATTNDSAAIGSTEVQLFPATAPWR